jgi:uncharacterized protein (TIGR02996 family)
MSPRDAFLADICERPDDDAPRLIYADWLDEHGDETDRARAEFIRVECRLAGLPEEHPERPRLQARRGELLSRHEAEWRAPLPVLPAVHWGGWDRGFIGEVEIGHAKAFRAHADATFAAAPVRRLCFGLRFTARTIVPVMASPSLARLEALSIHHLDLGAAGTGPVAASPHLTRLAGLALGYCRLGSAGAAILAASPSLRGLRRLGLYGNAISPDGGRALAGSPILDGVVKLALHDNALGDEGTGAIAASPRLGALRFLNLNANDIGDEGARALALSPMLPNLTELYLVDNHIGDAGVAALAASRRLSGLKALHLGWNRIGPAGALALATSTVLGGLKELTIIDYDHRMGEEGEAALRRRYGDRVELAD